MRQSEILRLERINHTWVISEPSAHRGPTVTVDSAVVAVTQKGPDWVHGYVLAVHGLDQGAASDLRQLQLNALGVGAQVKGFVPPPGGRFPRYQLTTGGEIVKDHR